jgi:iron complex outermembrane receptor protein
MSLRRCLTGLALAGRLLLALDCSARAGAGTAPPDADDDADELATLVVTSTRIPTLVKDEPLHIEVVPPDEVEENLTVQPGNLSSLLTELPSVRVQQTAPGLGGAGLQLRGMPTHKTLVLTDGLPLLGVEPDAFGLMQTPPLDLARVEVIKGAASALYGGGALGGVLNLVSKTADAAPEVLANLNSRGGRDIEGFLPAKVSSDWSGTMTAGVSDQSREDIDREGWADVPSYRRYALRPRAWRTTGDGQTLFLTSGITVENREGGTAPGAVLPDGSAFPEALETHRFDSGLVDRWALNDTVTAQSALSVTSIRLDRSFGTQRVYSSQSTSFAEQTLSGKERGHDWVLGTAVEQDVLTTDQPGVDYRYDTPGLFAQDESSPLPWLRLAGSARVDANSRYGTFLSPRASALLHDPRGAWSLRASMGAGYAAPSPFIEDVDATGLGAVLPLHGLHAERGTTSALDAKWTDEGWDLNASVFESSIQDPIQVANPSAPMFELANARGPRRAPGAEVLVHRVAGSLQILGSFSYIHATQAAPSGLREAVPLVPRESAEIGAIWENERRGRIGIEWGYVGRQSLEFDPYRSISEPYVQLNLLGELHLKAVSIYFNAIDLTNVRQTRFEPLVRTSPGPGGNPISEVWAPLAGRTVNVGIKWPGRGY